MLVCLFAEASCAGTPLHELPLLREMRAGSGDHLSDPSAEVRDAIDVAALVVADVQRALRVGRQADGAPRDRAIAMQPANREVLRLPRDGAMAIQRDEDDLVARA